MKDKNILEVEPKISDNGMTGYYRRIPEFVAENVPDNVALTYGLIAALTREYGYCFASNKYLAKHRGMSVRAIQKHLAQLELMNLIHNFEFRDASGNTIERWIFVYNNFVDEPRCFRQAEKLVGEFKDIYLIRPETETPGEQKFTRGVNESSSIELKKDIYINAYEKSDNSKAPCSPPEGGMAAEEKEVSHATGRNRGKPAPRKRSSGSFHLMNLSKLQSGSYFHFEAAAVDDANTSVSGQSPAPEEPHTAAGFNASTAVGSKSESYAAAASVKAPRASRAASEPIYRSDLFDRFYNSYPRKVNRAAAVKAWDKIRPDDMLLQQMLEALQQQKKSSQWQNPQYIPYPASWLNERRWEDDLPADRGQQQSSPRLYYNFNKNESAEPAPVYADLHYTY
ncbi:MAG: helix-turn-helix domain-containing protein [Candidatus Limivicinus sp.]|jgi:hypothetical protein